MYVQHTGCFRKHSQLFFKNIFSNETKNFTSRISCLNKFFIMIINTFMHIEIHLQQFKLAVAINFTVVIGFGAVYQ